MTHANRRSLRVFTALTALLLAAAVVALAIAAPTLRAGAGLQKRKLAAGRKEGR